MCSSTVTGSRHTLHDFSCAAACGVGRFDPNDILVRRLQAAFLMGLAGDSVCKVGILEGELALVDGAVNATQGDAVIPS